MKNIKIITSIISFCLLSIVNIGFAQDTIVKRDNTIVVAKILEISSTEIHYKRFDMPDGPLYKENKTDIKLIKYANGLKEEFSQDAQKPISISSGGNDDYFGANVIPTPSKNKIEIRGSRYKYDDHYINEKMMHTMLMNTKDKKIIGLVQGAKDANALQYIGFAAIPLGIGAIYFLGKSLEYSYGNRLNQSDLTLSGICLVGAIACPITSGIYKHKRTLNNREAIRLYNESY
jgi:hypothetical protein